MLPVQPKPPESSKTNFIWDGGVLLAETCAVEGTPALNRKRWKHYIYYPDTFEPLAIEDGQHGQLHCHNEPNGATSRLTNSSGKIVWRKRWV